MNLKIKAKDPWLEGFSELFFLKEYQKNSPDQKREFVLELNITCIE